jgi:predicted membrane GTPase involved in stress response
MSKRQAKVTNMSHDGNGNVRLEYLIPTRGLIGFRNALLTLTQGNGALNTRPADLVVNVCKEKKQSNVRSSTLEIAVRLTPAVKLSLEQSLDFIDADELVEVTPRAIRLRKRYLTQQERARLREGQPLTLSREGR